MPILSAFFTPPRFFAPEVVQSSAMDCGPAALKSLLEGFGIEVSYGRLREACQTDVDGTSINTLEETAVQLGLDAQQVMLPSDYVLLPDAEALPALIVTTQPGGLNHFVVVWKRVAGWVQVMDPAAGRRWIRERTFLRMLYQHEMPVPAAAWHQWAASESAQRLLHRRLDALGCGRTTCNALIEQAQAHTSWHSLAALDASIRMVTALVDAGGIRPGREAERLVASLFEGASTTHHAQATVPDAYWMALPDNDSTPETETLRMRGAVLVRVQSASPSATPRSADLQAALDAEEPSPFKRLWALLREDGPRGLVGIIGVLLLAAAGLLIEALLFRALLDAGTVLRGVEQHLAALGLVLAFSTALFVLEWSLFRSVIQRGRHLEVRLRLAFWEKLPRLHDRYFASRLPSDMAERSHSVHRLRDLPTEASVLLRTLFEFTFTLLGLWWLYPAGWGVLVLIALLLLGIPILAQPILQEHDLRVRTHIGALSQHYYDALLGLLAIRSSTAERPVLQRQEAGLVEWSKARVGLLQRVVGAEGVHTLASTLLVGILIWRFATDVGLSGSMLLFAYWALKLTMLAEAFAQVLQQYPAHRNTTLRLLEPLEAPEETLEVASRPTHASRQGVHVQFRDVSVTAGGHEILHRLTADLLAGTHVGIVGPSGSGKSSLVSVLLGWHRPSNGAVYIDGAMLDTGVLADVRRSTAWLDPSVYLWNESLLDNLTYAQSTADLSQVPAQVDHARLRSVVQRLPEGLQSDIGEDGRCLSGGEGQRVRLGRALGNPNARLVILDEPFRGLGRMQRQQVLEIVRAYWQHATLLFISHDIEDTLGMDRVLVLDQGQIVESGAPHTLAAQPTSRYGALLHDERMMRATCWGDPAWRTLHMDGGRLHEN